MAYTDFKSSMKQVPTTLRLLPIKKYEDEHLGHVGEDKAEIDNKDKDVDYTFEPNPEAVLTELYPRLLSIQLYQGLLESNACEHSARMMAMKNANEAAGEMVDSLNLLYNRARQASITQEIAEISAGRLALS
jgi:F-type H+-transporting ATPase subunit gamma